MMFGELNPRSRRRGLSLVNATIVVVILISVACTILQTEPTIERGRVGLFDALEQGFASLFAVEYFLRLWVTVEQSPYRRPITGRLRWALTPMALVDLLSWAPSLLLPGLVPSELLRVFRLVRILRLAKLGRMTRAWALIGEAVAARRFELTIVAAGGLFVMLFSATALYVVEGPVQPANFGSIPRALWWSAMTLTTIGYGDVHPITPLGKALAVVTAITGIGLVAAPTGIMAGAFSEAFQKHQHEVERDQDA